jgi:hypothetical protein
MAPRGRRFTAALLAFAFAAALALAAGRPDKETREKFYGTLVANGTHNATGADNSIAGMFDRVLEKEFSDTDTQEGTRRLAMLLLDLLQLP